MTVNNLGKLLHIVDISDVMSRSRCGLAAFGGETELHLPTVAKSSLAADFKLRMDY